MKRTNAYRTNQNEICFDRMLDEYKPNRCSSVESSVFELYHKSRKFSTTPKKYEILKNQKCEPRTGSERNDDVNHGNVQLCNNTDTPSLVNKANNVKSEDQLGSELPKTREDIFIKSLIDNSKNDDGKTKILKKPYELFSNDLIIHVRSERGIEIWTKVRGSFSNEYQIPSHLKETKPLLKYDHKLNKLALKNLHQHLEGLITEDDPNDTKDDLCGLTLGKVKFPGIPDAYERRREMYPTNYPNDRKLHYWGGDVGFDDNLYQKVLIDRVRKSKNILAQGISMHEILRANEQVDRLNEESMQFPYSKVETNSEEQSTINNSEESSQDASNNQERPRARGYECSICGDSFINEVLLELHQAVYLDDHLHRKRDRPIDSADP
ncbi:uncharacterized protein LOC106660554 [Trichogramma pretiosum]|uniref:uncharacterized protein LOC106660554 n=1 Tax=Trichogramma pretiosum TaxID=7493 RepID=UPI0006C9450B|nr:uncharacterized protein LOC106660554 [Trichogramma pretiosum]